MGGAPVKVDPRFHAQALVDYIREMSGEDWPEDHFFLGVEPEILSKVSSIGCEGNPEPNALQNVGLTSQLVENLLMDNDGYMIVVGRPGKVGQVILYNVYGGWPTTEEDQRNGI